MSGDLRDTEARVIVDASPLMSTLARRVLAKPSLAIQQHEEGAFSISSQAPTEDRVVLVGYRDRLGIGRQLPYDGALIRFGYLLSADAASQGRIDQERVLRGEIRAGRSGYSHLDNAVKKLAGLALAERAVERMGEERSYLHDRVDGMDRDELLRLARRRPFALGLAHHERRPLAYSFAADVVIGHLAGTDQPDLYGTREGIKEFRRLVGI